MMNGRLRFLVTAGSTREMIDSVRDWGNIFTGNTGYAIAGALAALGHVDLLTSNVSHLETIPNVVELINVQGHRFRTHADLKAALTSLMAQHRYDAVFMTAAVADYRPIRTYEMLRREPGTSPGEERWIVRDAQRAKVSSTHGGVAVLGERTEKIVDLFRSAWDHRGLLVKFKLEVGMSQDELVEIGQRSRLASGADYLVANTLDMVDGPNAGAFLLGENLREWVPRGMLARRLARLVQKRRFDVPVHELHNSAAVMTAF